MFDLSNITLAFSTAAAHEEGFALMCADMLAWHHAGEYPTNPDLIVAIQTGMPHLSAGSLKVYASRLLKWARSGKTPSNIRTVVNTDPPGTSKGKGGKPKGKKGNKVDKAQAEAPAVPNDDRAWVQFIEGIRAQVPGRKDWASEDIVALQDCAGKMIALIKRNAK